METPEAMRTIAVAIFVSALAAAGTVDATTLFSKGKASLRRHHEREVFGATEQVNGGLMNTKWGGDVQRTLTSLTTAKHFTAPRKPLQQDGILLLIAETVYQPATTLTWRIKGSAETPSVVAEASSYGRFELGPHVADLLKTGRIASLQHHFNTSVVHFRNQGGRSYSAPWLPDGTATPELEDPLRDARAAATEAKNSRLRIGNVVTVGHDGGGPNLLVHLANQDGDPAFRVSDNGVTFDLGPNHELLSITSREGATELPLPGFND